MTPSTVYISVDEKKHTDSTRASGRDLAPGKSLSSGSGLDHAAPPVPKKRGRKPGIPNKITANIKELIMRRGKPVELLCDVARGVRIRFGPQAGPNEPEWVYPDLDTRLHAARILLSKICPDVKAIEVGGIGGGPMQVNIIRYSDGDDNAAK